MDLTECRSCGKKKFDSVTWICSECGRWRRPKALQDVGIPDPPVTEIIKNAKWWKNKTMKYLGSKIYFDQDIRTGVCYFCKKENRAQKTGPTYLHHLKYVHSDPLAWTIEVCGKCHYQIDDYNRKILQRRSAPRDFAKAVDREAERIADENMSHEDRMRKYVRGYAEIFPNSENS